MRQLHPHCRLFFVLWLLCASALLASSALPVHQPPTMYLVLDGVHCGRVLEFTGGAMTAYPAEVKTNTGVTLKNPGQMKFEAITITMSAPLSAAVQTWIADTWKLTAPRRNGAIHFSAPNGQVTSLQFADALLTEVAFPALDAVEKLAGRITLTFQPALLTEGTAGAALPPTAATGMQKVWATSEFTLALDGMDCSNVIRIESFAVRQGSEELTVGNDKTFKPNPGKIIFPNLRLTLPENEAANWRQWLLMKSGGQEKAGYLSLMTKQPQTEIHRINLTNVGICRVQRKPNLLGGEGAPRVIVELYCEQMTLNTDNTPAPAVKPQGAEVPNGKGEFKKAYSMRQSDPLNFTLHSANYSVGPVNVGEKCFAPAAGEKLLVLHFTMENPQAAERQVRADALRISATDSTEIDHVAHNYWGVETSNVLAAFNLQPTKKVSLFAVITLPAKGEPLTILVRSNRDNDGPDLPYDVHGQVPALPAPFADPADATGATALEEVTAKLGTAYPCDYFSVTVEKMAYSATPMGEVKLAEGEQFLVCTLLVKNHTPVEHQLRGDLLRPELTTAKKELLLYQGMLLDGTDRRVAQPLPSGVEMRVCLFFTVPKGVTPSQLLLRENKSRRYLYAVGG